MPNKYANGNSDQQQTIKSKAQATTNKQTQAIPTGQALDLPSYKKVVASAAVTQARQDMQEISDGYQTIEDAIVSHAINCEERTRVNVAARLGAYWQEQGTADFFDLGTELDLAVPLPALATTDQTASLAAAS